MTIRTGILLCHECDLLVRDKPVDPGYKLSCPRCGHVLFVEKRDTVARSLAFVLTALICFYPAVTETIMLMELSGLQQSQSLISGVQAMLREEYYVVAVLTLITSILIPLFRLLLLLYITTALTLKYFHETLMWSFRLYNHLEEWGMLEVYMLGIIVSVVKMSSMAKIEPGLGLASYTVLLITSILASTSLSRHEVWELLESRKGGGH